MTAAGTKDLKTQTENPAEAGFRGLVRMSGLLDRVLQPYFNRFGISRSQWGVLRILQRAENDGVPGIRQAELCERLFVRPPSITGLIDRMVRLGYVTRKSAPDDLRGREVRITESGRDLLQRILQNHADQIASVMGCLEVQEQQQLVVFLDRLGVHLQSMVAGGFDGVGNGS